MSSSLKQAGNSYGIAPREAMQLRTNTGCRAPCRV